MWSENETGNYWWKFSILLFSIHCNFKSTCYKARREVSKNAADAKCVCDTSAPFPILRLWQAIRELWSTTFLCDFPLLLKLLKYGLRLGGSYGVKWEEHGRLDLWSPSCNGKFFPLSSTYKIQPHRSILFGNFAHTTGKPMDWWQTIRSTWHRQGKIVLYVTCKLKNLSTEEKQTREGNTQQL